MAKLKVSIDDIVAEIKKATIEADAAADSYARSYIARANLSPDGHIADSAGFAILVAVNPSYHFRKALLTINPKAKHSSARYSLKLHFEKRRFEQSYWFHRRTCEAAIEVWRQRFPAEEFTVDAWGD